MGGQFSKDLNKGVEEEGDLLVPTYFTLSCPRVVNAPEQYN